MDRYNSIRINAAYRDAKFKLYRCKEFLLQHTNSSHKPVLGLAGHVRTGFSEVLVCGGGCAPRERGGVDLFKMSAGLEQHKLTSAQMRELIKFWTCKESCDIDYEHYVLLS
jgi:hypothetical protein